MIYLVEDDESIRELVIYTLKSQGFETKGFERPSHFWKALEKEKPALLLLDVMLPEEDGISILKKLRMRPDTRKLPIIMLTAKSSEYDTVVGLDSGADDYIPKPFRMMELISRIRALLRRTEDDGAEEYQTGNLYVCPSRHIATVDKKNVNLTLKEYEVLCLLLKNSGTVLSRTQLLNQVQRKKITNSREKTGRKPGGQPGHKGHCRRKQEPTQPVIFLPPPEGVLEDSTFKKTAKTIVKQMVNIRMVLDVTEYHADVYYNSQTGERVHAVHPLIRAGDFCLT